MSSHNLERGYFGHSMERVSLGYFQTTSRAPPSMSLAKMHELAETNLFVTIFIELSVQMFSKFVSTSPVGFQYDPR